MITNWKTTRSEAELIIQIAKRASKMAAKAGWKYPVLEADMDVTAAHLNGCPLKLAELLDASDGDFSHDVFGIRKNINRETGMIENYFLPRYSRPLVDSDVDRMVAQG